MFCHGFQFLSNHAPECFFQPGILILNIVPQRLIHQRFIIAAAIAMHALPEPVDDVIIDPKLLRKPEPTPLVADARAIRRDLGWEPTVPFADVVGMMVKHDLRREGSARPRLAALAA